MIDLITVTAGVIVLKYFKYGKAMTHQQIIDLYYLDAKKYADVYAVPVDIVLSIIKQESSGNMFALGQTGDYGLCQITKPALIDFNRSTGKNYSMIQIFVSYEKNLEVCAWLLGHIKSMKSYWDWFTITQAYNAGVTGVTNNPNRGKTYATQVNEHSVTFKSMLI